MGNIYVVFELALIFSPQKYLRSSPRVKFICTFCTTQQSKNEIKDDFHTTRFVAPGFSYILSVLFFSRGES
jgi:hypothetical protein